MSQEFLSPEKAQQSFVESNVSRSTPADPRVSIIIPTYNRAGLLVESVASALAQTYANTEIVVVDDGSTDHTREAMTPYLDRIRYVHQSNQGRSSARNTGIQCSTGDYLVFLDSDDVLLPHAVESQIVFLKAHPHVDVVYANGQTLDENGTAGPLGDFIHPLPGAGKLEVAHQILKKSSFPPVTAMVRRAALPEPDPFNLSYSQMEDWDLWLRMVCRGAHFMHSPDHVALYRRHFENTDIVHPERHTRERAAIAVQLVRANLDAGLPARLRQDFRLEHLGPIIRSRSPRLIGSALATIVRPHGAFSPRGAMALVLKIPVLGIRVVRKGQRRMLAHVASTSRSGPAELPRCGKRSAMRCPTLAQLPPPPPGKTGWPWTEESSPLPPTTPSGSPWPRVSIVTPSFNQGPFLEETIRSVLLQGYPDLEYLIVDGGSSDGSLDIIRKYQSFLASWVSEPDGGQADAVNKGWARASGEIIAYLNSDDLYLPGAVAATAAYMDASPVAEMVYAYAHRVDGSGILVEESRPPKFDLHLFVRACFIRQPTVFLRRSLVDQIGALDTSLHRSLDYEYWLRACRVTLPARLPRATAADRFHAGAKSSGNLHDVFREEVAIFDRMFEDGTLPPDAALVRAAFLPRLVFLAGRQSGSSPEQRGEALERLRRLSPTITERELVDILGGHDAYRASPFLKLSNSSGSATIQPDVYEILPSLVSGGVIDADMGDRVGHRLRQHAEVRQAMNTSAGQSPWTLYVRLSMLTARHPSLLASRTWWVQLARFTSIGRQMLGVYYSLRDLRMSRSPVFGNLSGMTGWRQVKDNRHASGD